MSERTERPLLARRSTKPLLAFFAVIQTPLLLAVPAHAKTKRSVKHHTHPSVSQPQPTKNTDTTNITPIASDFATIPGKTALRTSSLQPMGDNNGVSIWVYGDASGTSFRLRLGGAVDESSSLDDTASVQTSWISSPTKIDFTGWHQVIVPKSQFTRDIPPAIQTGLDLALPADAQMASSASTQSELSWSDIKSVTLELTIRSQSTLTFDDLDFITLDETNKITAHTSVADFETGDVAAWDPLGSRDEKQSVTYRVETRPTYVHGGRVAFSVSAFSPTYRRKNVLMPSVKKSMAATGNPYLIFTPAALTTPILPTSLPDAGGTSSEISMQVCADQIQATSFCLYTRKALTDVTVTMPDDLQAIGHVLPKSTINVHVVKVWPRSGTGPVRDPNEKSLVPELLVKDDRTALSGASPTVRLTGDPVTDIPEGTTKQFWVTVSVPRDTMPGRYTGKLVVTGEGLTDPIAVPVTVEVLNLRLLSPVPQYAINLRSRLDEPPATLPSADGHALVTDYVSKDVLSKQLTDIVTHGFRLLTIDDSLASLPDAISAYRAANVMQPYVYRGDDNAPDVEQVRTKAGAPTFLYYVAPEPVSDSATRLAQYAKQGLPGISFMAHQSEVDGLAGNLEVLAYNRDGSYAQQMVRNHGVRTSSKRDWWYWSATDEDPLTNRISSGFLLWRSHLYGAFVPAYQEAFGTDPYDETSSGASSYQAAYHPQMLTYPTADGVIDTTQWEAVREGVTDARYLTTFYTALRECKDAHVARPLVTEAETYVTTFLNKSLDLMSGEDLDAARAKIAQYALGLRTAVDAYNKKMGN